MPTDNTTRRPLHRISNGLVATLFTVVLSACATEAQFLAQNSPAAIQTAESRAKFELDCPQVQTTILSQKVVESIQGYAWRGARMHAGPWTEYTIGVRGCGRQAVYLAVCRDPANCNAVSQGGDVRPVLPPIAN